MPPDDVIEGQEVNQKFLQEVLIPWIGEMSPADAQPQEGSRELGGERQKYSEHIVDMMLMVYRLGSSDNKIALLSQLCKVLVTV